jgi:tetraacyldisaccharide 4'-kinase|tara:strand:- start:148 stop:1080 length:933 start_codon:yes stop_codon:yes gene_type:complete
MNFKKPKFWDHSGLSFWSIILYPFSLLFLFASLVIKILKIQKKFPIPIICVGNIYVGGTGKTPLAKEIFQITKSLGKNPAFIKKYYSYLDDEINMLQKTGKTFFLNRRKDSIEALIKNGYNLAILDDGFQDLSIYKNFNIVCFNQKQWTGNHFVIPAGPLREKLSALKRADCILINGNKDTKIENQIYKVNKSAKIFYSKYKALDIDRFKEKKICAFAGIGNPSNFFELLKENNLNLVNKFSFSDHHDYSYTEIENMVKKFNDCILLTTEKDYCRIPLDSILKGFKIEYLKIRLEIENKDNFIKLIKDKI